MDHPTVPESQVSSTVYEENLTKNWSLDIILSLLPQEYLGVENIKWSYTGGRLLEIPLKDSVSVSDKIRIQDAVDLQFGPGKVKIL